MHLVIEGALQAHGAGVGPFKLTAGRTLRRLAAFCGIAGPVALTVYFAAPAFLSWPYSRASADQLTSYALSHHTLFYA